MLKAPFKMTRTKVILAAVVLISVVIGLAWWHLPVKVFLVDSKTNAPIANRYVKAIYDPICVESPCGDWIIFAGNTGQDGSIWLKLRYALNANKVHGGLDFKYEYSFETRGYMRDIVKVNPQSSNIIYLTQFTEPPPLNNLR